MSISFECQCGKPLKVRDELAGKRVKCPKCGQSITAPEPDEEEKEIRDDEEEEREESTPRPVKPAPPWWARLFVLCDMLAIFAYTIMLLATGYRLWDFLDAINFMRLPDSWTTQQKEMLCLLTLWFPICLWVDILVLSRWRAGFVLAFLSLLLTIIHQSIRGTLLFDGSNAFFMRNNPNNWSPYLRMIYAYDLMVIAYVLFCIVYDGLFIWAAFKVGWKRYK